MIRKPITDNFIKAHQKNIAPDKIDVFMLNDGKLRAALLHGTRMINQMRANHSLGILETLALGHAYLGAGLLTSMIKGNDRIAISIECGGPIKGLSVEATAAGDVRGYLLVNPIPIKEPMENFDLSPFFGPGFLKVTKYLESSKQPFTGQIMLRHGRIAKDLAVYFLESEQLKTAFALSVYFDKSGRSTGAGGLFLQALPGADEKTLEEMEDTLETMPSIGEFFSEKGSGPELINSTFKKFSPEIIGEKTVLFNCGCSKERFTSFLASMNSPDQEDMLKKGPFPLVTSCYNCGTVYEFSKEELQSVFSN